MPSVGKQARWMKTREEATCLNSGEVSSSLTGNIHFPWPGVLNKLNSQRGLLKDSFQVGI